MEYVSLGSNCSITYQLNKYGLRTNSYPFDWTKITIQQLIAVLENDFVDYVHSIQVKKISSQHPHIDDTNNLNINTNSVLTTNSYGITFAHEFICKYQLDEFMDKITQRIERFRNLSIHDKIRFIRIETSPIKTTFYSNILKLLSALDKFATNYELVLIVHKDSQIDNKFPPNISIYKYANYDPDWKMESFDLIDWNMIFDK